MKEKKVLLLGPGNSLGSEEDKIHQFITDTKPVVISVNFEPSRYECDYVFVSNAKRYSKLADATDKVSTAKLITTSNITLFDRQADYVLNYSSLIDKNGVESDNALLLAVAFLQRAGVHSVTLVGFDGFTSGKADYYDSKYAFAGNNDYSVSSNEVTAEGIKKLAERIEIKFLTKSLYESMV